MANISLGRAILELVTDLDPFNKGLDEAGRRLKDAEGKIAKVGGTAGGTADIMGGLASTVLKVGSALGIAFSAGELLSLAQDTIAFASNLDDLSKSTGISTDGLQRLGFAGKRVGVDINEISGAVLQMSKRLAGGDESATGAVQGLGLSVAALTAMRPDQAFVTIATAIAKIEDPMLRAKLAFDLFGRTGTSMLPLMEQGIEGVLAQADRVGAVLGKDAIKALDDFGDAMGDLSTVLKVMAAEALSPLVGWFTKLLLINQEASKSGQKWIPPGLKETTTDLSDFTHHVQISADTLNELKDASDGSGSKAQFLANQLKALRAEALQPLTAEQQRNIVELQRWGKSEKDIADLVGTTAAAVHRYTKEVAEATAQKKTDTAEADRLTKAHAAMLTEILKIENVLPGVTGQFGFVDTSVLALSKTLRELAKDLSAVEGHGIATGAMVVGLADELQKLGTHIDVATLQRWADEWAVVGPTLEQARGAAITFDEQLHTLAASLTQLAQVSGDSFGGIVRDIGTVIAAWDLATQAVAQYQSATGAAGKGLAILGMATSLASATSGGGAKGVAGGAVAGAKIGSIFGPWGTAIGAGVGALIGLGRAFAGVSQEELAAREAIGGFTDSLAGMETATQRAEAAQAGWAGADTLVVVRDGYLAAGRSAAEAEAMVAKLWNSSQDGGKHTKEIIDQINAVMVEGAAAAQTLADEAAAAAAAQQAAEQEAADARQARLDEFQGRIDEMLARRDALIKSVEKEAPERVMGVIEKAQRAEIASLDKQMAAEKVKMEIAADEMAKDISDALGKLEFKVKLKAEWHIPDMPKIQGVEGMAAGGVGRVTKPTLFLAGEGGPEDFAFSGGHQSFGSDGGGDAALAAVQAEIAGLRRDFRFTIPNLLAKATVTAAAKSGR